MKKLSNYKLKKISNNLDHFFNIATDQNIKNNAVSLVKKSLNRVKDYGAQKCG